uniref:Uncharacterized protein n=1 Tax=Onchocerca volvulus TaxID=6282 RepID=A0A8R1TT19_ONCVO
MGLSKSKNKDNKILPAGNSLPCTVTNEQRGFQRNGKRMFFIRRWEIKQHRSNNNCWDRPIVYFFIQTSATFFFFDKIH